MRVALLMVSLLALSACKEEEAEDAVRQILLDPTSAQFSAVGSKGDTVCGLVNSKNLFGAYTGAKAFIVDQGSASIASSDLDILQPRYSEKCPPDSYHKMMATNLDRYNQKARDERGF